jgi:beta-lactamase class D
MFRPHSIAFLVPVFCGAIGIAMSAPLPLAPIQKAMKDRRGAFVIIDCASGEITDFDPKASAEKLPPCSTFKIWNALLGLEEGILSSPEQPFYQWDGVNRDIAAWNKDLNLRDAFQASCVPAFQNLADRLGADRMNRWLDTIGYGDKNTSAGLDVFWLPAPDRRTILISPREQAALLHKLVSGKLPIKTTSLQTLKHLMRVRETPAATLYGKTGSGTLSADGTQLGWFVGFVESCERCFAFAAAVQGTDAGGAETRSLVETILLDLNLLNRQNPINSP